MLEGEYKQHEISEDHLLIMHLYIFFPDTVVSSFPPERKLIQSVRSLWVCNLKSSCETPVLTNGRLFSADQHRVRSRYRTSWSLFCCFLFVRALSKNGLYQFPKVIAVFLRWTRILCLFSWTDCMLVKVSPYSDRTLLSLHTLASWWPPVIAWW